ncbi:MAG: anaerobic ribonucleoside-triphosphate reductase activating protein [Candidatus Omnitrophica bacterium]|nr:anaerobic ribonucleoside-triphosphate reductase activating protein [Candidatus Omnitrophota bacterium]
MNLAGFQKISLVDYPGRISAIIFTQGCNFMCPYCYNKDLVPLTSEYTTEEDEIFKYLEKRKNMIEGVVVTGGEPVLHKNLRSFILRLKEMGYKVKLDTNGTDPEAVKSFVENKEIDYVALDIKTSFKKYHLVTNNIYAHEKTKELIDFLISSDIEYEFRTTCVPGIVEKEDFFDIAGIVSGAKNYYLQQFAPVNTLSPQYAQIKPYTKKSMEEFSGILSQAAAKVSIRGI